MPHKREKLPDKDYKKFKVRKVGQPLKFSTPEDLQDKVNKYFEDTPFEEWTITGLALTLNISRQGLYDYDKRPGYAEILTQARALVEHSYEIGLKVVGGSGHIFGLKNFGWKDTQQIDATISGTLALLQDRLEAANARVNDDPSE